MGKQLSKTGSSMRNMLSSIILNGLTVLSGFIVNPYFKATYGPDMHGLINSIQSTTNYLTLVSAGLGMVAVQALYAPLARKDRDGANAILSASNRAYNLTGGIFTALVVALAGLFPLLVSREVDAGLAASLVLIMGISGSLEYFLYEKYRVLLMADQKLYIVTNITIFGSAAQLILRLLLMYLHTNILLIMLVPGVVYFLRVIALMGYVHRHYSWVNRKVSPNQSALKNRWSALIHQIAGMVVNNTDVVVLTIFGGLKTVSIYAAYNFVFTSLYSLMTTTFSNGTLAAFGHVISEDDLERVRTGFKSYEFLYYMLVSVIYTVTAIMILPYINLLFQAGSPEVPYVDTNLAVLFVAISLATNLRVPSGTMINAKGHYKETQFRALTEAIINIVVSLLLVRPLGIYGVLIGTIASFSYRTLDIILYSNRHILRQSVWPSLIRGLRCVVIVVLCAFLCWKPAMTYTTSLPRWFVCAIAVTVLAAVVTVTINFVTDPRTMKEVWGKLKSAGFIRKRA